MAGRRDTMHQELHDLFVQDQAGRQGGMRPGVAECDRQRRRRLTELLAAGALQEATDYWHAAMLLQHGDTLDDYWQAHDLAKRGATLGHAGCRWLAAAAYDRWLVSQGKPQRFGTQSRTVDGRLALYPVDPTTTDAERAEWLVKPLADLRPSEPSHLLQGDTRKR